MSSTMRVGRLWFLVFNLVNKPERAIELFEVLLKELDERELYVPATTDENKWETYRFYLGEQKDNFMHDNWALPAANDEEGFR